MDHVPEQYTRTVKTDTLQIVNSVMLLMATSVRKPHLPMLLNTTVAQTLEALTVATACPTTGTLSNIGIAVASQRLFDQHDIVPSALWVLLHERAPVCRKPHILQLLYKLRGHLWYHLWQAWLSIMVRTLGKH